MFKRRQKPKFRQKLRESLWPSMGWSRAAKYFWYRLRRLHASPHAIALGLAFGVFTSWTPFMGLHIAFALILAYLFRGNLIAAAFGTALGNPITFPLIWIAVYKLGARMMGEPVQTAALSQATGFPEVLLGPVDQALPVLIQMTLGSLPIGISSALLCYVTVRFAVAGFQRNRRQRLILASTRRAISTRLASRSIS